MKHILFFIHGMGTHDAAWHTRGAEMLRASFREYDQLRSLDFDAQFELHPLVYDDRLQALRDRANADFAAFKGAVLGQLANSEPVAADSLERELDKLAELGGVAGGGFAWTHALDVVLYRFASTVRAAVDVSVARQILHVLGSRAHIGWSVLAHSLGTSVIHNTLNSLYNTGFTDDDNGSPIGPLNPVSTRCATLAMIANVSRVLQREEAKVLETRVKPGPPSPNRLCSYYLNVRHKLDPFTKPKPFNPDLWPDETMFSTERYQHIRPSHIAFEADELSRVHAFDHYLMNPRVHVPLFRSLLGRFIVGSEEFRAAKARFDAEIRSQTLERVRARLESRLPPSTGNWRSLLAAIRRFLR